MEIIISIFISPLSYKDHLTIFIGKQENSYVIWLNDHNVQTIFTIFNLIYQEIISVVTVRHAQKVFII